MKAALLKLVLVIAGQASLLAGRRIVEDSSFDDSQGRRSAEDYLSQLNMLRHHEAAISLLQGSNLKLSMSGTTGTIYVMRHAERDNPESCLNKTGWMHAYNLSRVFFGARAPKGIFAYNYQGTACARCLQTATPLAASLQLCVNQRFPIPGERCLAGICSNRSVVSNAREAAAMIEELTHTDGGPILAVWESSNIGDLLRRLGVPLPAGWKYPWCIGETDYGMCESNSCENNYNRLWTVNFKRVSAGWIFLSWEEGSQGMPCLSSRVAADDTSLWRDAPAMTPTPEELGDLRCL